MTARGQKFAMLRAFLIEDNPTIRRNLTEALEEMAAVDTVGFAASEAEAKAWLASNDAWDIAIVDLFLVQGSGLGVLPQSPTAPPLRRWSCLATTPPRRFDAGALSLARTPCSTNRAS